MAIAAGVSLKLDPVSGELVLAGETAGVGCKRAGSEPSCVIVEGGDEGVEVTGDGDGDASACASMARELRARKGAGSKARGKPTGSTEVGA